jgi:LDH2 family malate/lactate/ureidoglycolate dehydrogenase
MEDRGSSAPHLVGILDLRNFVADVLRRLGHPDEHATMIADVLVDGDLRGYADHGVQMLGSFLPRSPTGRHNPRPAIRVVIENESTLLLDGDRGFGVMPGMQAMRWCIERAKERRGIVCAAVRRAGHVIGLAPYVELAARAGVIGFACANAVPAMAPPAGRTKVLGTNPMAFGVPAGRHYPVILDMATSATAARKIIIAALAGRTVPEGLIADAQGHPTTDPREFWPLSRGGAIGSLLPLGWPQAAHKGFGLSMLVDLLAGVLSGGGFGRTANTFTADVGQFYWALDVRAFMPLEEFLARVDAQIDQVKASERISGVEEIVVPGERGQRRRAALLERGTLSLSKESWDQLVEAGEAVDLTPPELSDQQALPS